MSSKALAWALEQEVRPASAKLLLIVMADVANHTTREIFTSIAYLEDATSLNRKTIFPAIEKLVELGIIEDTGRRTGKTNQIKIYRLTMEPVPKTVPISGQYETDPIFPAKSPDFSGKSPDIGTRNLETNLEDGLYPSLASQELPLGDVKPEALVEFVDRRWGEICASNPGIAKIRKIDPGLAKTIDDRGRMHARDGETPMQVWDAALKNVETSAFLCGRAPPGKGRDSPFRLSIGWMSKASNFREILGGRYNAERSPGIIDEATGRRLGPTDQALRGSIERLRNARERSGGGRDQGRDLVSIGR